MVMDCYKNSEKKQLAYWDFAGWPVTVAMAMVYGTRLRTVYRYD